MKELREWAAFERIYPFPTSRSDIQAAIVAQAACSAWGKPPELKAFIPDYTRGAVAEDPLSAARRKEQELLNAVHR